MIRDEGEIARLESILAETDRRESAHAGTNHRASSACAECRAIFDPEPDVSEATTPEEGQP